MQARSSDENSVLLAVCPSVKRMHCDKTKEKCVHILHHTKDHLAYSDKKNVWWKQPLLPEINGQSAPRWSEIADFEPIIARSASAVT